MQLSESEKMDKDNQITMEEIRMRSLQFIKNHQNAAYEKKHSQIFWHEFFQIFGHRSNEIGSHERYLELKKQEWNKEKTLDHGFIDYFWPGKLLIEQKSKGRDLRRAEVQALHYFRSLKRHEKPRYILVCDFQTFRLIDLHSSQNPIEFELSTLRNNLQHFKFIWDEEKIEENEAKVSIKVAASVGKLYKKFEESGHRKDDLREFMTRLVYCMFADDTEIFRANRILYRYLKKHTLEDGSDMGSRLAYLFQIFNTHENERPTNLDSRLAKFPYINGQLFEKTLQIPQFDAKMRQLLLSAANHDWKYVSPEIFGTLFQSIMNKEDRHDEGVHYTIAENILKVINPLFMDALNHEFEKIKKIKTGNRIRELQKFQKKLSQLKFLDPACGSGNFLIIAYRELRRLELDVIDEYNIRQSKLDIRSLSKVSVNQFYGIDLNEFSQRLAQISLWIMEHKMNLETQKRYGENIPSIPITTHPNITHANSLKIDWNQIIPSNECSFIFGNPPFVGARKMSTKQKNELQNVAGSASIGTLDYVTAWFIKAAEYVNKTASIGFVAVNSITQGDQVGPLWGILGKEIQINFAHRSFKWQSDAKGQAQVSVVIMGLSKTESATKHLFPESYKGTSTSSIRHISPYLISSESEPIVVSASTKPINGLQNIRLGSQPIDGGYFILDVDEKSKLIDVEPESIKFIKPFLSGKDFINNKQRYILDLQNILPEQLKELPEILKRVNAVKKYRLSSDRPETQKLANTPTLYAHTSIPTKPFLIVPNTSSEKRDYIPIGYVTPPTIPSNATMIIENADVELFGLLTSKMHMIWLRTIGGKLESRLRYSGSMVYNTFPVPQSIRLLKPYAQKVLNIRNEYPGSNLAILYDPITMPPNLKRAHIKLDKAVDKLYRKTPFASDQERLSTLLNQYAKMLKTKT